MPNMSAMVSLASLSPPISVIQSGAVSSLIFEGRIAIGKFASLREITIALNKFTNWSTEDRPLIFLVSYKMLHKSDATKYSVC